MKTRRLVIENPERVIEQLHILEPWGARYLHSFTRVEFQGHDHPGAPWTDVLVWDYMGRCEEWRNVAYRIQWKGDPVR